MHQQVYRVRRNYNRWVANQTLEDYALRFTAKKARKWSAARVSHTALGAISFLALEAIGGAITLKYGFSNAVTAIMAVSALIFLTGLPICYHAAKQGTDIDLLTRGAGFGYIGSTVTSLIYASFTFIFFALEAAILALALELTLGIPLSIGYIISAVVVIPLVTHGITLISRFQVWTQPLWIFLQVLPLVCIAFQSDDAVELWVNYSPTGSPTSSIGSGSELNLVAFGAASAVLFSLMAQIGEQVDFLRFLPEQKKAGKRWWFALIAAGPGWIVAGAIKILIGSFLAVMAINYGIPESIAADPNQMYLTAFSYLNASPELTLVFVGVFVVLSQIKINITNAYAGSIAWSNFFSRLTHHHPGRVVWLVFNVAIALTLMELGIYRVLEEILSVYSIVALAWIGSLVADLVINKPLGLRPQEMEFKRAHLYDINPVGFGSMIIASALGFVAHYGALGETAQALSSFMALGITFICAPLIAWLTKGRYYIARPVIKMASTDDIACCICDHHFEPEDMTHCPAYAGPICSLCCTLDSRCQDMCKEDSRFSDQLNAFLQAVLPKRWVPALDTPVSHFLGIFMLTGMMIACILGLVYFQITVDNAVEQTSIASALFNVFFILMIIFGVLAWMFSLVHDSRRVAQEESQRHTELLMNEIEAHKQTDLQLQQAKVTAENANKAKSRYLTGISHELRSPLNAIMGYAQLLEKDASIPDTKRNSIGVIKRSSEHLADLIEGLLDISRIEAGRLDLRKADVHLPDLLDQIVSMFRVQAEEKGIRFEYTRLTPLPETIRTDEKRLRQILINLLSNAIKYTEAGTVSFRVHYRNQVAEFSVEDTGTGIAVDDIDRIFHPFERLRSAGTSHINGTGLGLTITRFMIDIMGGDLQVKSTPGQGSLFSVSLMLPSTTTFISHSPVERTIKGYMGEQRTVFVVDDEPDHCNLLCDTLGALGFNMIQSRDGKSCLDMLNIWDAEQEPEIFLLDVFMPEMSGWELAVELKQRYPNAVIIMISANANEDPPDDIHPHNAYLIKPIRLPHLLETLAKEAQVEWTYADEDLAKPDLIATDAAPAKGINGKSHDKALSAAILLDMQSRQELISLAKIGYAKGVNARLDSLETEQQIDMPTLSQLRQLSQQCQFGRIVKLLEEQA